MTVETPPIPPRLPEPAARRDAPRQEPQEPERPPRFAASLLRLGSSMLSAASSRAELAAMELDELRGQLLGALVASLVAVLLVLAAFGSLSAWVVVMLWPHWGGGALVALAALYGVIGAGLLFRVRAQSRREPPFLEATLG